MNIIALFCLCCITSFSHAAESVFIEELTWPEIRGAIVAGKATAIIYAGSTEQNGPHMVTGKHNLVARHVARQIATRLGNALIYPIMPYAPTGDPESRSEHMRFPGSVSVSDSTFAAVARDVARSARAAGFRNILLMGDHGGGQQALSQVAESLDRDWSAGGVHVYYIGDLYARSESLANAELVKQGLKDGLHAGIIDTSELLFVDKGRHAVRKNKIANGGPGTGVDGDPRAASRRLGERFIDFKIKSAVDQIRLLTNAPVQRP